MKPSEYLEKERFADVRHELLTGHCLALPAVDPIRSFLAFRFVSQLEKHLIKGTHSVYVAKMKVRVGDNFYYPDVAVSAEVPTSNDHLRRPVLIAEIARSTDARNHLEKFVAYSKLTSLREYVLIADETKLVEVYRPLTDGWEVETFESRERFRLTSLDVLIELDALYADLPAIQERMVP